MPMLETEIIKWEKKIIFFMEKSYTPGLGMVTHTFNSSDWETEAVCLMIM